MRFIIALALLVAFSGSGQSYDKTAVRAFCDAKWGSDFSMVKYCVDQQSAAGNELDELLASYPTDGRERRVLIRCTEKWNKDLEMIVYCAQGQYDALDEIASYAPSGVPVEVLSGIRERCSEKWGEDFEMVQYCTEDQTEAWRSLQ